MNRLSRGAVVGAILVPLVTAGFIAQEASTRDGARLFGQVLDLVGTRFVDTVSAADLYEKAARGLVEQLQDPYSDLLSPKELAMFNTTTGGRYGGLGMQIEEQKGKGVTVARVFPHTPAERSGWNWQPNTLPRATTATKRAPYAAHASVSSPSGQT